MIDDPFTRDRVLGTDAIYADVKQFKRLLPFGLDDHELAHRMAMSPAEVRNIRRLFGSGKERIAVLGLDYRTRVILGKARIATINGLLARKDSQLRKIPGLGPKTLTKIKTAVCAYMEENHS